jgi:5-methylcytosine-specific restriction endonuclease McrA
MIRRIRKKPDPQRREKLLADIRRMRDQRDAGYRERALALYPHVCGRCGREFTGKDLRELTVHHKDSDHMNNPPDGSNWELLCLYCHDAEHDNPHARTAGSGGRGSAEKETLRHNPFEGLAGLAPPGEEKAEEESG